MNKIKVNDEILLCEKYIIEVTPIENEYTLAPWSYKPQLKSFYRKCKKCELDLCDFDCFNCGEKVVSRTDVFIQIFGLNKHLEFFYLPKFSNKESDLYEFKIDGITTESTMIERTYNIIADNWDYKFYCISINVKCGGDD